MTLGILEVTEPELEPEPEFRLHRDLREAANSLSEAEARFLVDYYYMMQKDRIRAGHQARKLDEGGEPHMLIAWLGSNTGRLERAIKSALEVYVRSKEQGKWAISQTGIGPVITAGLLAHIDIEKGKTISAMWRFAGLDPTQEWLGVVRGKKLIKDVKEIYGAKPESWEEVAAHIAELTNRKADNVFAGICNEKGVPGWAAAEKYIARRPWNSRLKTLCYHIGECFKRTSGREDSFYGKLYRERKALEIQRNNAGMFKELASKTLGEKSFGDNETRKAYEAGLLPAGRLDLRATRYATKMFLSHFWQVSYEVKHGVKPPKPWIIEHGGHQDFVPPPNWPIQ